MPVTNQGTPTVQVSVPVPTPVQQQPKAQPKPRKAPKPARSSQEDPVPNKPQPGGQPQQVQAQLPPPVPVPRAIILPWAPPGGSQMRMRRLPKRVIKMAAKPVDRLTKAQQSTYEARRITSGATFYTDRQHLNEATQHADRARMHGENGDWRKAAYHHFQAANAHQRMADELDLQGNGPFSQSSVDMAIDRNQDAANDHLSAVSEALARGGFTSQWKPGDQFPFPSPDGA